MPTSPIVDVVVGLLFFFTALSLLSSAVQERIASALNLRSRGLEAWLVRNLGADITKRFYENPIIASLGGKGASYIPSQAFATALFEICQITVPQSSAAPATVVATAAVGVDAGAAAPAAAAAVAADPLNQEAVLAAIRKLLETMPDAPAVAALRTHFEHAQGSVVKARQNVETWFDAAMERVSGAYKRQIHWNLIIVAALVAVALNADVLRVAKVLYRDQAVRSAVAEQARAAAASGSSAAIDPQALASNVPLPLAWQGDAPPSPGNNPNWYLYKVVGLLLTVAGVSLGAPFWFDLLNRVVNMRAAGPKPKPETQAAST
jgi:hypothetical protein